MRDSTERVHQVSSDPREVFDPSLAEHPTLVLEVTRIVDMLHVTNAPDVVDEYGAAMRRGAAFPPISLVRLCGIWFVADGHKRLTAYRALGAERILVEVWPWRRWLRDQAEQARASLGRWSAAIFRGESASAGLRELLVTEIAHVRRMLVSLASLRGSRRPR